MSEIILLFNDEKDFVCDGFVGDEFEDRPAVTGEFSVGAANDVSAVFREKAGRRGRPRGSAHRRTAEYREKAVDCGRGISHRVREIGILSFLNRTRQKSQARMSTTSMSANMRPITA